MKRYFAFAILGAAMIVMYGASAEAQATRTWVSGVGDDVNPCSRTAPCKTFAGAISKTAARGEINCLDSGGFGALTITKSITVYCNGVIGGVLAAGTNGIVINAGANDIVTLRGLDIDGVGTGLVGIRFLAGAALHVQDTLIRNFRGGNAMGIEFAASVTSELYVSNTVVTGNGTIASATGHMGIQIRPTNASTVRAVIKNVEVTNNAAGVRAETPVAGGIIRLSVTDSNISGNTNNGLIANATVGGVNGIGDRLTIAHNGGVGVRVDGGLALVRINDTTITGNGTGTNLTNGGQLGSYGNNRIDGNVADGPNPGLNNLK